MAASVRGAVVSAQVTAGDGASEDDNEGAVPPPGSRETGKDCAPPAVERGVCDSDFESRAGGEGNHEDTGGLSGGEGRQK